MCFVTAVWCVSNPWWPFSWQHLSPVACELPCERSCIWPRGPSLCPCQRHLQYLYPTPALRLPPAIPFGRSWLVFLLLFPRGIVASLFTKSWRVSGWERVLILEIALKHNDGIRLPEKLTGRWQDPLYTCPLPCVRCFAQHYGGPVVSVKPWVVNAAFNGEFLPWGHQSRGRLWFRIIRLSSWHSCALLGTE